MPPQRTAPDHCVTCARPMRVSATPTEGTVRHASQGNCQACHARLHYVPKPRPSLPAIRPCPDCGRNTRPAWRRDLEGLCRAAGGRCEACKGRASRAARGVAPRREPSALAEDFYFIAADQGERDLTRIGYTAQTRRVIAGRLGVTVATLDRALYRHLERTTSQH